MLARILQVQSVDDKQAYLSRTADSIEGASAHDPFTSIQQQMDQPQHFDSSVFEKSQMIMSS